ncbi:MAG: DUF456 domain-containing protein [Planctomycetota bacterium]
MWDLLLLVSVLCVLMLVNAAGVLLTLIQLPGNWLILLATAAVAWWRWDDPSGATYGWWTLGTLLALALVGEIVEFVAAAYGARSAGASRRAAGLSIVGAVVGAIAGALALAWLPVVGWIFGGLIGSTIGAGVGSMLGDMWAGRTREMVWAGGKGAAVGKLWGSVAKLGCGGAMWVVALVGAVWP